MKTLTKILTVVTVVVLCVCLFTVTAHAAGVYVKEIYTATTGDCYTQGNVDGYKLSNGKICYGTTTHTADDPEDTLDDLELAGLSYANSYSDLLTGFKHDDSLTEVTEPDTGSTCIAAAKHYYECSCGKRFVDAAGTTEGEGSLPLAAHTGTPAGAIDPTCGSTGLMAHFHCSVCGKLCDAGGSPTTMAALMLPKTSEHSWGDWNTIKEATNVSPGNQVRVCSECGEREYQEIPATGITDGEDIYHVIVLRDTWLRGEEPLTFRSPLVDKLNAASGPDANYVGVRIGTDSLYENSYDTFDFWSWDQYVKLGEKTMQGLRQGTYRLWIYDKRNPEVYTNSATFYVVDVPTLEPYSTDKHVVNSSKSLRFIASDEIDPDSVQVGSRKLYDSSDYFVSNDRKNITLSADFLNNRQTGTYTISARTTDGRTIKTNFYILSTAQASSSPRTGDESQIGLWAAFLLLSGAAVVVLVPKLRKTSVK